MYSTSNIPPKNKNKKYTVMLYYQNTLSCCTIKIHSLAVLPKYNLLVYYQNTQSCCTIKYTLLRYYQDMYNQSLAVLSHSLIVLSKYILLLYYHCTLSCFNIKMHYYVVHDDLSKYNTPS